MYLMHVYESKTYSGTCTGTCTPTYRSSEASRKSTSAHNSYISECVCSSFLPDVGRSGEAAAEYLALFKALLTNEHWRFYLALRGVLTLIGQLMSDEIDKLTELEETSLTSDLSLGFAMKALTGALLCYVVSTIYTTVAGCFTHC